VSARGPSSAAAEGPGMALGNGIAGAGEGVPKGQHESSPG